ncbi:MAG: fimbria/pilus periplasmic chaperone [Acidobacteria bacterium]|nr:fimbria/pilus periplasmic chaperone [Acidobacteriota bacterium]MDW7983412.1 fimbria/pilus periplasmic chaperone [Acidobacteriota bacterium]
MDDQSDFRRGVSRTETRGPTPGTLLILRLGLIVGLLTALGPLPAVGAWRVTPIRVELDARTRSATVTVLNEGDEPLYLQMKTFEWTQDAEGNDQYKETDDLIFFPKIMEVPPNDARLLRVGLKAPAVAKERTYRLFLEEIPAPRKAEGAQVAIAVRFGLPIFVKPVKEEAEGVLENVTLSNGQLNVAIRNMGNTHFFVESISVQGKDANGQAIYTQDVQGWYLLSGAARTFTVKVPAEVCSKLNRMDLRVKTDRFELKGGLDVQASMCATPMAPATDRGPTNPVPSPSPAQALPLPALAPPSVLTFIQSGRLDEAVRWSLERLRQWVGPGWLLQVEIACQSKTVVEDAPKLRPAERIYLLPRMVGGRSCYTLAYGIFRSPAEAWQIFTQSVDATALDLASSPVLLSVDDALRRSRGSGPGFQKKDFRP